MGERASRLARHSSALTARKDAMALPVHRHARVCRSCSRSAMRVAVVPRSKRRLSRSDRASASSRSCKTQESRSKYASGRFSAAMSSDASAWVRSLSVSALCAARSESSSTRQRRNASGKRHSSTSSSARAACHAVAARISASPSTRASVWEIHSRARRLTRASPRCAGRRGAARSSCCSVTHASSISRALSTSHSDAGVSSSASCLALRMARETSKDRMARRMPFRRTNPVFRHSVATARRCVSSAAPSSGASRRMVSRVDTDGISLNCRRL